jgi:hypothetical protein
LEMARKLQNQLLRISDSAPQGRGPTGNDGTGLSIGRQEPVDGWAQQSHRGMHQGRLSLHFPSRLLSPSAVRSA